MDFFLLTTTTDPGLLGICFSFNVLFSTISYFSMIITLNLEKFQKIVFNQLYSLFLFSSPLYEAVSLPCDGLCNPWTQECLSDECVCKVPFPPPPGEECQGECLFSFCRIVSRFAMFIQSKAKRMPNKLIYL